MKCCLSTNDAEDPQPNVVTKARRAGVQTGNLIVAADAGTKPLLECSRGLHILG